MEQLNRRKKKWSIWVIIALFFILFGGILLWPSPYSDAFIELQECTNEIEVKQVWDRNKNKLGTNKEFEFEVRRKLESFSLTQQKIDSCLLWLPETPLNINVIVVPDLSDRLTDTVNFPDQKERDVEMIKTIWNEFAAYTGVRETKNRFMITLAECYSANKTFENTLNRMYVDMANEDNSSSHIYFNDYRKGNLSSDINKLYQLGIKYPVGSDFYTFFDFKLKSYLRKSTLYDRFVNKLIILTDGGDIICDSSVISMKIDGYKTEFKNASGEEGIINVINKNKLNLKPAKIDLSNTEVLILGIGACSTKEGFHAQVISAYWKDWIEKMGSKNPAIVHSSIMLPKMLDDEIHHFIYDN